jgi:sugar lactone lactonase YvrE
VCVALTLAMLATLATPAPARLEPTVRVVAGGGTDPSDGVPATDAQLSSAEGVAARPDGTLVIADTYNNRIRQVDRTGTITTIAGTGAIGSAGDGGPAQEAELFFPFAVDLTPRGEVIVADTYNQRIRRIDRRGHIATIAGTGTAGSAGANGPATEAQLRFPFGVDVAANGDVLIADTFNHRVVTIDRAGKLRVVAGTGVSGSSGDGGSATDAQLRLPYTARWGQAGRILVADTGNDRVRVIERDGTIRTVAGDGTRGFSGDGGPATEAQLAAPHSVAVDASGRIVIGDTNNDRLREIRRDGTIATIAGGGSVSPGVDGTSAGEASLNFRTGLTSPRPGVLILPENANQRVLEIR